MAIKILLGILCAIGILLLILLLAVFILIFCKICVILNYVDGQFSLILKIGFYKKQLVPGKKKDKKQQAPAQKKESKIVQNAKKLTVEDYFDIAKIVLEQIVAKIYFEKLHADFHIVGEDAAQTAIRYGQVNAAVYPLTALIYEHKRFKDLSVQISPDFLAKQSVYNINIILYTRVAYLLKGLLSIAKYFI